MITVNKLILYHDYEGALQNSKIFDTLYSKGSYSLSFAHHHINYAKYRARENFEQYYDVVSSLSPSFW